MRRISTFALALGLLGTSACSGPRNPIEVAVKEFPGDVAIGKKTTVPPATTAPTAINPEPVGFPSFLQPPPPIVVPLDPKLPTTTTRVTRPPVCGTADPLAVPKREALKNVPGPPAASTLTYRNTGTFEITSRDGKVQRGTYPPLSTRTVVSKARGDGTYDYQVAEQTGGNGTITAYWLNPAKGLYLRGVSTRRADGSFDTFVTAQDTDLLLLPLPVTPNTTVGGVGLDPRTATSMTLVGSVIGKATVDACGTPLDTWEVQITEGRITGPNKQVRFTATYNMGTQYGALSLRDVVDFHCDEQVSVFCDNGQKVLTKNTAVVSSEPKVGGSA